MFKKLILISLCLIVTGCAGVNRELPEKQSEYPLSREDRQREEMGKLTGESGLVIFGGKDSKSGATDGINVNSYLWRASLDIAHKMPLISADPFGGSILTDWYRASETATERYKLNIYIVGTELRSDAVRVAAFKQVMDKKGNWSDAVGNDLLATEIENKILLKARAIKYKSGR